MLYLELVADNQVCNEVLLIMQLAKLGINHSTGWIHEFTAVIWSIGNEYSRTIHVYIMGAIKTSASRPFSMPRNSLESKHYQIVSTHHLDFPKAWYIYVSQRAAPLSREINKQLHSMEIWCWCDWLCCVSVSETRACWAAVGCRLLIYTRLQRIVLYLNFPREDHELEHSMLKIDERWVYAEPSARRKEGQNPGSKGRTTPRATTACPE